MKNKKTYCAAPVVHVDRSGYGTRPERIIRLRRHICFLFLLSRCLSPSILIFSCATIYDDWQINCSVLLLNFLLPMSPDKFLQLESSANQIKNSVGWLAHTANTKIIIYCYETFCSYVTTKIWCWYSICKWFTMTKRYQCALGPVGVQWKICKRLSVNEYSENVMYEWLNRSFAEILSWYLIVLNKRSTKQLTTRSNLQTKIKYCLNCQNSNERR